MTIAVERNIGIAGVVHHGQVVGLGELDHLFKVIGPAIAPVGYSDS